MMNRRSHQHRSAAFGRSALAAVMTGVVLLVIAGPAVGDQIAPELNGVPLRKYLREHYTPRRFLSYKAARKEMFSKIDNRDGKVRLVYTGASFATTEIPDHTKVNTEHTWPQSKFGHSPDARKMKTDLHHLYPTFNRVNGARGNSAFAEIPDERTEKWWRSPSAVVGVPSQEIDEYSESTKNAFEPREDHKGNVARAMLYFYVIYEERGIDQRWFKPQADTFKAWNDLDRVDDLERTRSRSIAKLQGNENPFVLDPTLVNRVLEEKEPPKPAPAKKPTKASTPTPKQDERRQER